MCRWQEEVARMHDANKATAKKGHEAVMELDTTSAEVQVAELDLTMKVAESDERLAEAEEKIRELKERQDKLVGLMESSSALDAENVKIAVGAFMSVCHDGNKPLHSEQFAQLCKALQLSEEEVRTALPSARPRRRLCPNGCEALTGGMAQVEAIKHERRKRRSRLGGKKTLVAGGMGMLKRQLSAGAARRSPSPPSEQ